MDTSEVFAIFETINNKLDKRTDKLAEPVQVDLSTIRFNAYLCSKFYERIWKINTPNASCGKA